MKLLFALILVMTVFSGCKELAGTPTDDIIPSLTPVYTRGNYWVSFHHLFVLQNHHNVYLIRCAPAEFSEKMTLRLSILNARHARDLLMDEPKATFTRLTGKGGSSDLYGTSVIWPQLPRPTFQGHPSIHL